MRKMNDYKIEKLIISFIFLHFYFLFHFLSIFFIISTSIHLFYWWSGNGENEGKEVEYEKHVIIREIRNAGINIIKNIEL